MFATPFEIASLGINEIQEIVVVGSDTFIGYAEPGSTLADPHWKIKKITQNGSNYSIRWSLDGQIFNDYATVTYK